ncbi:DGF-1 4 domain-containing protein [Rhizoctonia solani AG-1 IA]|uniref:DGF-1 4 domain-containing protein n=1 Tax=Thanatephorus cucumeris (strain AG1-IA) TaxID=983506 RepID=L8WJ81_THACA|nr:DGF-1 4 domain-containing protein [Rhizoctonia solani AG-1 IA]
MSAATSTAHITMTRHLTRSRIPTHSPCLYSEHQYRVCVTTCYLGDVVADRVTYIHPISRDLTVISQPLALSLPRLRSEWG